MSNTTDPRKSGISASTVVNYAQFAIPMALQSSGTVGNNGALSALTAMPAQYAGCYMYFPLGALYTSSPAAWYWVVMSSTTAGTVYANTYTSGVPTAPLVATPIVATGPGAYAQTTAEITMFTNTVPGGLLGLNGKLRIFYDIGCNSSAGLKTFKNKLGGTLFQSATFTTSTGMSTYTSISNKGSLAVQSAYNNPGGDNGVVGGTRLYTAVNTATDQALSATGQLATATDYLIIEGYNSELLPA